MLKTRVLLVLVSAGVIWLIFLLPKVVVNDDTGLPEDSVGSAAGAMHAEIPPSLKKSISDLRDKYQTITEKEKSAIFADSLAEQYRLASKFDSAAWFAGEAASFFNTPEAWKKAGNRNYEAYTFALDAGKQQEFATKAQEYFRKVLDQDPGDLTVKTKLAMTYLSSPNPMQGISMLREVLADDPRNTEALFNLGMLSVQSGQYDRAVERLEELIAIDSTHIQGQLLLGVAWMSKGDRANARRQFEKVKAMNSDPAIQAEADSYLKELK